MWASDHSLAVGHADQVTHYAAARPPATWPHRVGVVPPLARRFRERPGLAPELPGDGAPRTQVLVGAPGTGKTQLAARHAHTAWQHKRLDLLVWATASRRSSVVSAYAQAYGDITGTDPVDAERAAQAFLAWLRPDGAGAACRWLVVLDDAADFSALGDLWPPQDRPTGQTVVTTRRRDAARESPGRRLIAVGPFAPGEGAAHLAELLAGYGRQEDPAETAALAAELGHSPLALSQAAARLAAGDLDCARYRRLLTGGGRPLSELVPGPGALPDGQPAGMHEVWQHLTEQAVRSDPDGPARPLTALLSVFDAAGVPEEVFDTVPARACFDALRTVPRPERADHRQQVVSALELLHRQGLVERTTAEGRQVVRCDRVMQRALRDWLSQREADELARTAADCLVAVAAADGTDAGLARLLYANCRELVRRHETALLGRPSARQQAAAAGGLDRLFGPPPDTRVHDILIVVPRLLGRHGDADAARRHFTWLAGEAGRRHGSRAHTALLARGEAAHWRGVAGDAPGAAAELAAVAAEQRAAHAPGDDVLASFETRSRLAHWRGEAGDPAGAAAVLAELLHDQAQLYGRDPRGQSLVGLFTTRRELAHRRGEAGDPAGAAAALGELLRDQLRELHRQKAESFTPYDDPLVHPLHGPDHLGVFTTHGRQAYWLGRSGDAAGAVAELTHLLAEQRRVLGEAHPDTLATGRSLDRWRSGA
ncbi:tetratricopeptide repeat protein [Streptomyces barkulensis]|uniref:tetratricopeptide repeat protein n=1 Tax=Streptomyces barkulensis TaxID=1257026 RepID=UPI000C6EE2BF|nr:tetratricopeptide repeat protein [Streptomyces barkulensis]